jgi:sigma-B regulation protein RsbU (phosphoserine phosphatase)
MIPAAAAASASEDKPTLRLAQDVVDPADVVAPAKPATSELSTVAAVSAAESHLEQLQRELDRMRDELDLLRRRDVALQFYMHRLDEELKLAARVQQDFLPKSMPKIGPLRFHTLFRPAAHVSGDLYDVMRLDESHVGFYMADAVGHGMPAALLTMFLKQALVTKVIDATGYRLLAPSVTMQKLNDALVAQNLSTATFATALYGNINYRTRRLTFARGGHPDPLLLSRDGELKILEAEGALLGIFPDDVYQQTAVELEPGDRVFIYSDGVEIAFSNIDAPNPAEWRALLHDRRHLSTEQIIADLRDLLARADANSDRKKDDLTVIAIEVER